jgi:hypothetical protein
MQTPTLAEPEAAAAVEEAAVEAAVEEAAVEAEEPPQAVRTPVAPTTAEAFRKSRREIIFIILFSFINAYHSISQSALVTRFAVSVCIITIRPTIRNRTNRQDYLPYFVSVPQYILLYPKIFLLSSTILHICATSVQIYCVCAYFYQIRAVSRRDATILSVCSKFLFSRESRQTVIPFRKYFSMH